MDTDKEEQETIEVDVDDDTKKLANDPERLHGEIQELSLKEFNKVLDEIFKDNSLSKDEKLWVINDLHRITHREFSYETIGKILGISKQGAYKVEQRALKKLKKEMKKAGLSMGDFT